MNRPSHRDILRLPILSLSLSLSLFDTHAHTLSLFDSLTDSLSLYLSLSICLSAGSVFINSVQTLRLQRHISMYFGVKATEYTQKDIDNLLEHVAEKYELSNVYMW
jgi:hypothetical protein